MDELTPAKHSAIDLLKRSIYQRLYQHPDLRWYVRPEPHHGKYWSSEYASTRTIRALVRDGILRFTDSDEVAVEMKRKG